VKKAEDIANYMVKIAKSYGMSDIKTDHYPFDRYYSINIFFSPVDSDDTRLNDMYVALKEPFKYLGYEFKPVGDNILSGDTRGVTLNLTIKQLEDFVSSDVFTSITGLKKFKL